MSDLLKAFDNDLDFNRYTYFVLTFNALPSNLKLSLSLKATKKNMEKVLSTLKAEEELVAIFKNWDTKDAKNTELTEDFPYEYLFRVKDRSTLVWISLYGESLFIDFLYDIADDLNEDWVLTSNHIIRTTFGEMESAPFKVLHKNSRGFRTKNVNTGTIEPVEIKRFYNDDFVQIHSLIKQSLSQNKSGLILLHGEPGTGKTSYIKNLISEFSESDFVFIQNEFINELLKPEFISFLLNQRNAILIIEDAEKVILSRNSSNDNSVVSTILQLTDGLFSDYLNIKVICTFNSNIAKVDKALLRKGRMIADYEFKALAKEKANALSISLGFEPVGKDMILADIFKQNDRDFEQPQKPQIGF